MVMSIVLVMCPVTNQVYLKGEELTFIVIDKAGNQSIEYKQNALTDDIAPNPIENIVLNKNGQNFTAQAKPIAKSKLKILRVRS